MSRGECVMVGWEEGCAERVGEEERMEGGSRTESRLDLQMVERLSSVDSLRLSSTSDDFRTWTDTRKKEWASSRESAGRDFHQTTLDIAMSTSK